MDLANIRKKLKAAQQRQEAKEQADAMPEGETLEQEQASGPDASGTSRGPEGASAPAQDEAAVSAVSKEEEQPVLEQEPPVLQQADAGLTEQELEQEAALKEAASAPPEGGLQEDTEPVADVNQKEQAQPGGQHSLAEAEGAVEVFPDDDDTSGWETIDVVDEVLDNDPVDEQEDIVELLTFVLSSEEYAFKVDDIEEIIRPQKIASVPRIEEFVLGITSLRGKVIPVIDLKKRFLMPGQYEGGKERVLILKGPKGSIGVLVDMVSTVVRVAVSKIVEPPSHLSEVERKFIEGVAMDEGRFISIIRMEEVLDFKLSGGGK